MTVTVCIPSPLQNLTENKATLLCEGQTFSELLEGLGRSFPRMKQRLYNDQGDLSRSIRFYINSEDIMSLKGQDTPLNDGDEVTLICAMSGG